MSGQSKRKGPRALVVWDFDRVFFDTDRFNRDVASFLRKQGVGEEEFNRAYRAIQRSGKPFSVRAFLSYLKLPERALSERRVQAHRAHLLRTRGYTSPDAMDVLRRLKKQGALHFLVSFASPPYQYHKIRHSYGKPFLKLFEGTTVTPSSNKPTAISRILARHPSPPSFFVDDEERHIISAKAHFPDIITIHFQHMSLGDVEGRILKEMSERLS